MFVVIVYGMMELVKVHMILMMYLIWIGYIDGFERIPGDCEISGDEWNATIH